MKSLRVSTVEQEGVYQAAKWLKFYALCDDADLVNLFERLGSFAIFPLTGVGEGKELSAKRFLDKYHSWIDGLKNGIVPEVQEIRSILAAAFVNDFDALWLQEVPGKGYLMKIKKPVIQVQAHWFSYSPVDRVFRPMSLGLRSVFWGLQFSYPQIYQDPTTMELKKVEKLSLFETIRYWVRDRTRSTPFVVEGTRINTPIRLGKKCFSWINDHPELIAQGIVVHGL